jgi:hypothetical protein
MASDNKDSLVQGLLKTIFQFKKIKLFTEMDQVVQCILNKIIKY